MLTLHVSLLVQGRQFHYQCSISFLYVCDIQHVIRPKELKHRTTIGAKYTKSDPQSEEVNQTQILSSWKTYKPLLTPIYKEVTITQTLSSFKFSTPFKSQTRTAVRMTSALCLAVACCFPCAIPSTTTATTAAVPLAAGLASYCHPGYNCTFCNSNCDCNYNIYGSECEAFKLKRPNTQYKIGIDYIQLSWGQAVPLLNFTFIWQKEHSGYVYVRTPRSNSPLSIRLDGLEGGMKYKLCAVLSTDLLKSLNVSEVRENTTYGAGPFGAFLTGSGDNCMQLRTSYGPDHPMTKAALYIGVGLGVLLIICVVLKLILDRRKHQLMEERMKGGKSGHVDTSPEEQDKRVSFQEL